MTIEREAWRRFCAELNVDPDALLRDLPASRTVTDAEDTARELAFTAEEAVAAARARWRADAKVQTVEDALADLRAGLTVREEWWT